MNNRVLIVDDHPAVRMAIQLLLASEGFDIVAETDNGADALTLAEKHRPSTLILDIGIPSVDGLSVISKLVAQHLPVKIVVFTGLPPSHLAERCRHLGAHGFVSKQDELAELVYAVRAVRADQEYFPELTCLIGRPLNAGNEYELFERLSIREFRVMQQLVQGQSNKEIAATMQLSSKTVSTFKKRLLQKLNISSFVELYELAKRNGLA